MQRVLYLNGVLSPNAETVWQAPNTVQGLTFEGPNILQIIQSGSTTEYAMTLSSSGFKQPNSALFNAWNVNGDGAFSNAANWNSPIPNAPGAAVLLGDGATNRVHANAVHVTVDAAYTAGSVSFETINGTAYTLVGDGVAGHGLTLDGGAGASVNVYSGNHTISTNLTLADAGGHFFNVGGGSTLTVSGAIGEAGGSRSLTMNDAGTLVLAATNSYSGGTTVRFGSVQTQPTAPLAAGR